VSNNVTVIDGATNNTTTVAAGTWPYAVAVNPNTNQIYVVNNGSNNVSVIVGPVVSTTTTLASSANLSMSGSSVMFTATVATSGSKTPTGTVAFMDGATTLGSGTLNGSGIATYTTSSLALGQHSMTTVYGGDANNAGSTSSVLTQTVNAADFSFTSNPTSTTVTAGHSGTFTLTVTPQGSYEPNQLLLQWIAHE
jgi:DNA-binding beta-propeller fold protein YncE